jgi:hypothetical protein
MEKMEEFLASVEESVASSLSSMELPDVREKINQLWTDITRYGPAIPKQTGISPLGDWEVPLPPPLQPPPPTFSERAWAWAEEHPWRTGCLAAGVVGGGLLVGYGGIYLRTVRARRAKASSAERRQVVGRCL